MIGIVRYLQVITTSPWYMGRHKLCQYHLLSQPWQLKFTGYGDKNSNKIKILEILYNWCTSWFTEIETEEELDYSVQEFKLFIRSADVIYDKDKSKTSKKHLEDDCGSLKDDTEQNMLLRPSDYLTVTQVGTIMEFITTHLLDKKHMFARCYYFDLRTFEEATTNPVEQQNSANKTGYKKTAPNMNIMTSAKKMTQKSRSTHLEKNIQYSTMIDESNLWSNSSTAQNNISNIKGLITQDWCFRGSYDTINFEQNKYWI